jgi:TolA-binding protein
LDAGSCALAEQGLQSLTAAPAELQAERGIDVADCFYAEGNHRRALARYEDVAQRFSSTPAAANATYESGRVAALLGEHRQAQMWFDAYLVRFPSGPLAGEALFRRCSLLPLLQMRSQALTCLQEYRSRFPGGSRTATTHYQEATLLREDADCPGALRAYARYLEHPGPLAAQAREWAAWCQRSPLHDAGE